jgi:GntR family transcriptional regulator
VSDRLVMTEISAAPDPLYLQVYDAVADAIASGRLKPGDRLPTERSLCAQFDISRATVRRAMRRLSDEGLIDAKVGRGSFVRGGPLAEPPNALMSFTELARARGLAPSSQVLAQNVRPATLEETTVFGIDMQDLVFDLERLRLLDDAPLAIERTRIPVNIAPALPHLDFGKASVYEALESAGAAPTLAEAVVRAELAEGPAAVVLDVPVGAPLVICTTMSYDAVNRLVEIGEIAYRADRYQFQARLTRPPRDRI